MKKALRASRASCAGECQSTMGRRWAGPKSSERKQEEGPGPKGRRDDEFVIRSYKTSNLCGSQDRCGETRKRGCWVLPSLLARWHPSPRHLGRTITNLGSPVSFYVLPPFPRFSPIHFPVNASSSLSASPIHSPTYPYRETGFGRLD
jgi:hypothetical protein